MAKVDLNRNRESILLAHKEVFDTNNPINWALFSYEGQTNVLKLVSKGDGGFEEFMDDLNSGKIMYGYLCVLDPNTNLPKYVFVNWQGEGVPEMKKGSCANHVRDVAALLRGAHVTINARSEEDLDEDDVMDKVSKASGSNYSVHKEKAVAVPEPSPVLQGSVYKRIRPQAEIQAEKRDAFWEKTELEERQRISIDRQRSVEDRKKAEKELKEREARDAQERERKESERLKHIRQVKDAENKANITKQDDGASWEKQQEEAMRDEQERQRASERMRQERAKEAQSLVAGRKNDPRSMFKDKPQSQFDDQPAPSSAPRGGPPPPRKLRHDFLNRDDSSGAARKAPIQLPTEDPGNAAVLERPGAESTIQQDQYEEPAPRRDEEEYKAPTKPNRFAGSISVMPKKKAAEPEPEPEPRHEPTSPASPQATGEPPATRNLLSETLPKRQQDSDEEEDDEAWEEPTQEDFTPAPVAPAPVSPAPVASEALGQCARALYDYQAAEDNEITFDPDDLITNIEQIDDGWWVGVSPDGARGMFPSNYVELI
ncbi:hypothetical protein CAPTEDRAFT_173451 [Capitella teleta]|uniref:ADF-H domain-containing protein n=1 Tax=Capitella teleta TaxID=283909 RepID=R7T385_CAPTE|nr:hypothetical protein CAPTEDRAFT_173451 [Capitella teleta]|eukprot:ELT87073.1 hypothetical protein CAPTEDRAFT_173451 [Capitella teleta]